MVKITFNCQVISPMFIGNASTQNAELRPSAIKASMRFWWRAIHPNLKSDQLRINECELFGGSYIPKDQKKEEEVDLKSEKTKHNAPQFRILNFSKIYLRNIESNFKIDPRKPEKGDENWRKNYLSIQKPAIVPNTKFAITFLCQPEKSETLIALMHLSSALGGLGNRSRRGAGSWKILNYEENKSMEACKNIEYDLNSILATINKLNDNYVYIMNDGNIQSNITQHLTKGGFPYLKKVEMKRNFEDEEKLRLKIMETAHKFKNCENFDKFIGKASKSRLASPIYVSMVNYNDGCQPIISTLSNCYPYQDKNDAINMQDSFKTAIFNDAEPK